MTLRHGLAALLTISLATPLAAAEAVFPRHLAPSPDGSEIAFSWQGDVWVVDAAGGAARRLTIHPAYDHWPRWSPDGREIVFVSDRWGNDDLFVMAVDGGAPRRLTHHSSGEALGGFWPDGGSVVFAAYRGVTRHPHPEIYRADLDGGTPTRLADVLGRQPAVSPDGSSVAFVRGRSARYRKDYEGAANRDVWILDLESGEAAPLTDWDGDDEAPMWGPEGRVWWVSQEDGTANLWSARPDGGGNRRHTDFSGDGPRDPAMAADGSLVAFEVGPEAWVHDVASGESRRLTIEVPGDALYNDHEWRTKTTGASDYAVGEDEDALAVVVDGEVWVMDLDRTESHRVTHTPQRESSVAWTADGSALLFVSDRTGVEELWLARPAVPGADPRTADDWEEFRLTTGDVPSWLPVLSPGGESVAYVRDYGELVVAPFDAGAPLPEEEGVEGEEAPEAEESDAEDGEAAAEEAVEEPSAPEDRRRPPVVGEGVTLRTGWDWPIVAWSPDGAWIAWAVEDIEHNSDVWVAAADGSVGPVNVSAHPDSDGWPAWSENGRVLAFSTRRTGDTSDIWYVYLRESDEDLTDRDRKDLWKEEDEARKDDDPDTWVEIDLDGIAFRVRPLTRHDGDESQPLVTAAGDRVVFRGDHDGADLYSVALTGGSAVKITSGHAPGQVRWGPGGDVWYRRSNGTVWSTKATKSQMASHQFSVRWRVDRRAERAQVFDEAWRWMDRGFYDPGHHGADWDAVYDLYRPWALAAAHPRDFDAAMDIMLGELNGSHLGYYGRVPSVGESSESTGHLGVVFGVEESGVRVLRVIPDGPADTEEAGLVAGDLITAVEGVPLGGANLHSLLVDTIGKPVGLSLFGEDGEEREATVRPISYGSQRNLLYEEWVDDRRALVGEWSGGRLGYLHIRGMNTSSLERFEAELYSIGHGREGLVVDVRDNGGGWTTDYLLAMLMVRRHAYTRPRGAAEDALGYPQSRLPMYAWPHPIVVICNEGSYSNAEIFSHAVQTLGRATLVGVPTHGAVISTGGRSLIDGSSMRYPFRGWYTADDLSNMENGAAVPDVLVVSDLADEWGMTDAQLAEAVETLLREMDGTRAFIPGE